MTTGTPELRAYDVKFVKGTGIYNNTNWIHCFDTIDSALFRCSAIMREHEDFRITM